MKTLMKSRRGESVFIISIAICLSVLCQSRLKAATEVSPRGVSQSHARLEPIESWLDERVESIEYNDMLIGTLIGRISKLHIPICFEGVEFGLDKVQWIRDRGYIVNSVVDRPKHSISFSNITYRQLLDEIIMLDQTLQWNISPNGVINVFPRGGENSEPYSNSILNDIIPELDVENVKLAYLLSNAHPFGRMLTGTYGLSFGHLVLGQDRTGTKEVSVSLRKATIRECLNAIVKSAGDAFYWHVESLRRRDEWIHGKEIDYRFYWVGQRRDPVWRGW